MPPMALVDDVEEHVGGVGAVGEIADFVDDEDRGMRVDRQGVREFAGAKRAERSSMSVAAVVKKASKPF
jgi:hypothetical protein